MISDPNIKVNVLFIFISILVIGREDMILMR